MTSAIIDEQCSFMRLYMYENEQGLTQGHVEQEGGLVYKAESSGREEDNADGQPCTRVKC